MNTSIRAIFCLGFSLLLLACEADDGAQGACDPDSCTSPPASKCREELAVQYEEASVCDAAGKCQYNAVETDCETDGKQCVEGECLTAQEAACVDVVCETPPENTCAGNTIIEYLGAGVCNENGFCTYDFTETLCDMGMVCEDAICVSGIGADPCEGVVCDSPPADTCNGNAIVSYDANGVCENGICNYASTESECGAGTLCSNGVCLDENDPCAGVQCVTPPADTCNEEVATIYPDTGICGADGQCTYAETTEDCSANVTPPAAMCEGDTATTYAHMGSCVGGACTYAETTEDCSTNVTPPPGTCEGDTATTYAHMGSCVGGACTYAETTEDCSANVTPPQTSCQGNTAITYASSGSCENAACIYAETPEDCGTNATCTNGVCVPNGEPCDGETCTNPPTPVCQGHTSITYANPGTCVDSICNYTETTTECRPAANCVDGVCVDITEIKVVINEIYHNPPTSQGNDVVYEFLELYNAGKTINLLGWQFTSGITHTFEDFSFENGTYLVLVNSPESYNHLTSTVFKWDDDNLVNTGNVTLRLVDESGIEKDSVTYANTNPDPDPYIYESTANNGGKSLELGDPWSDNSDPANWHASVTDHGTPGAANSP